VPRVSNAGVSVDLTVNTDVFVIALDDVFLDQDILSVIADVLIAGISNTISFPNRTLIKGTLGFESGLKETSHLLRFNLIWLIFKIQVFRNASGLDGNELGAVHYLFLFLGGVDLLFDDFLDHL
jgi:hypothetical protein